MAEYIIDKIEYGGNVYKLQDSVSDFLTGAVTALSTIEGQHSTITNQNGAVSIAIPTKTSHLTNDSNFVVDASYVHTDNNFTATEKNKLAGIASGAEVNVQADWNVTSTSSDAFIKNKPTIPTVPTNVSAFTNDVGYITLSDLPIYNGGVS